MRNAKTHTHTFTHTHTYMQHHATTLPKFNSSPPKSYQNPLGKACLPFAPFFRGKLAVKLRGGYSIRYIRFFQIVQTSREHPDLTWQGATPSGTAAWNLWVFKQLKAEILQNKPRVFRVFDRGCTSPKTNELIPKNGHI